MHLPDHYLDPTVCAATAAVATTALAGCCWRYRRSTRPTISAVSVTAAGIFAAQMLNFPVNGGTSGHLIGGALAAILLGPWPAMVLMTVVLAVQSLLFADGGVAALGANILNMAVVAPLAGRGVYRFVNGTANGILRRMIAAAVAAWVSVMAAAVACSVELSASGAHALSDTLAAMASIHAVIGLSESLVTAAVVGLAFQISSVQSPSQRRGFSATWVAPVLAVALVVVLAPLASTLPDGLESVAERLNFHSTAWTTSSTAFIPDYALQGVANPALATVAAGLIGIAACAALTWGLCRIAVKRQADSRN